MSAADIRSIVTEIGFWILILMVFWKILRG